MFNETTDYLRAENFNRSIEIALRGRFNKEEAIMRVTRRLAACPEGTLYIRRDRENVAFYVRIDGKQKYVPKNSEQLYWLARRKYLELLLKALELTGRDDERSKRKREETIAKIQETVTKFDQGKLNLSRIVMTQAQYNWYFGQYYKKSISRRGGELVGDNGISFQNTGQGEKVRSKSERDIGNALEYYGVPYHYEERLVMDVRHLVDSLRKYLAEEGKLMEPLFDYYEGSCHWNVPPEFEWMNSRGSLWRTYNDAAGTVTIYTDFRFLFVDHHVGIWEHEGNIEDFIYRTNAGERLMIMLMTGNVGWGDLTVTYERDVNNANTLNMIIEESIVPRLWF